jgi:putative hemolysin
MGLKGITGALMMFLVLLAAAGCSTAGEPGQLANPASVYCEEQGGNVDLREGADGGTVGYCLFDDGSECEEWAFFRGECQPGEFPATSQIANPAAVYCGEQGGTYEIREHEDGSQYGVCVFEDGSECEAWAFFRGECQPGDHPASSQIANPAAVYCSEQGGTYEIRANEDGSQYGVCVFEDGSECDAWAFFRGECQLGDN